MPDDAQRQVIDLLAQEGVEAAAADPSTLAEFRRFAAAHPDCCERHLAIGHFTGSAWVVSADGERVLLTHHRKLNRWLQPGGHADGKGNLAGVALREAEEETGLRGLRLEPTLFDIDRHAIPARGSDPEHWHYDVRFVVHAGADDNFVVSEESHALAWRPVADVARDPQGDESVRRMAARWLDRQCAAGRHVLDTARLRLHSATAGELAAIGDSDAAFETLSGRRVEPGLFPEADRPAFAFFGARAATGRLPARWGSYLILDRYSGDAIGTAGYKGPPHGGAVEIGYSVAPARQGRGIAREAATALIAQAFEDVRVEQVLAHTLAMENASVRVLRSLGFRFVADVMDPDDGAMWKWELTRAR